MKLNVDGWVSVVFFKPTVDTHLSAGALGIGAGGFVCLMPLGPVWTAFWASCEAIVVASRLCDFR